MTQPVVPLTLTWTEPTSGTSRRVLVDHAIRFGADSRQNDVCLPFEGVQTLHAEILSDVSGRWELVALGGHSILVNQAYVSRAPLDAGDTFSIGPVDFTVSLPALTGSLRIADITAGGSPDRSTSGRLTGRPSPAVTASTSDARATRLIVIGGVALALAAFGGWSLARIGRQAPSAAAKPTAPPVARTPSAEVVPTTSTTPPAPMAVAVAPPPAVQTAPGGPEPFTAVKKAVVTVIARLSFEKGFSSGTGFFVTGTGRLITNFHVVKHTDYQQVLLAGSKKPIDARVVAMDEVHDLALLQAYVDPPVPYVSFVKGIRLKMGDPVFALGSPAGPLLEMSMTRGIVSTDRPRQFGEVSLIQHDASINPGNSGGPLLDQDGHVVGINTLKIKDSQGLGFAIPLDEVMNFLEINR